MRTVLRMQKGDMFQVQENLKSLALVVESITRYTMEVTAINKTYIEAKVIGQENVQLRSNKSVVCVALPNKMTKLELICQKLTEIGVWWIYFWQAERSQLRELSENKWKRIKKIMVEAAEQSFSWTISDVGLLDSKKLQTAFEWYQFLAADMWWTSHQSIKLDNQPVALIIWPEWWLTERDYKQRWIDENNIVGLWKGVLRMETAAIVWGWRIANL